MLINTILMGAFIFCILFCVRAFPSSKLLDESPIKITKSKKVKDKKRLINIYPDVIQECDRWCMEQCKYVQVDPNNDYKKRYVCDGDE